MYNNHFTAVNCKAIWSTDRQFKSRFTLGTLQQQQQRGTGAMKKKERKKERKLLTFAHCLQIVLAAAEAAEILLTSAVEPIWITIN